MLSELMNQYIEYLSPSNNDQDTILSCWNHDIWSYFNDDSYDDLTEVMQKHLIPCNSPLLLSKVDSLDKLKMLYNLDKLSITTNEKLQMVKNNFVQSYCLYSLLYKLKNDITETKERINVKEAEMKVVSQVNDINNLLSIIRNFEYFQSVEAQSQINVLVNDYFSELLTKIDFDEVLSYIGQFNINTKNQLLLKKTLFKYLFKTYPYPKKSRYNAYHEYLQRIIKYVIDHEWLYLLLIKIDEKIRIKIKALDTLNDLK